MNVSEPRLLEVVKTSQPLITPYRNWNSVFFQACSAIFLSQYTHQAHFFFAQLQAHRGRIACKRMKRRQATEPNQVMNRKNAYNRVVQKCNCAVAFLPLPRHPSRRCALFKDCTMSLTSLLVAAAHGNTLSTNQSSAPVVSVLRMSMLR